MRNVLWFLFSYAVAFPVCTQVPAGIPERPKDQAVGRFEEISSGTHHLYSGPAYLPYAPIGNEHPFFGENRQVMGQIKSDGIWYDGVPMKFDLQKNVLVVPYYFGGTPIELISWFVEEFVVDGHRFRHFRTREEAFGLTPGFYEVLASGKVSLVVEWKKSLSEMVVDLELKRQFVETARYYLLRDGVATPIRNRAGLMKVLTDRRPTLRAFVRNNPKASMASVVEHYNFLKP